MVGDARVLACSPSADVEGRSGTYTGGRCWPGGGIGSVSRHRLHACRHCRASARKRRMQLHSQAHRGASTGAPRQTTRDVAASRRHAARLQRQGRRVWFPTDELRGHPASADPARSLGSSRCTAWSRRPSTRTGRRSRSSCCRRSVADRRCGVTAAGASATRTALVVQAEWRIMVNRLLDTACLLRRREGHRRARRISTSTD